MAAYTPRVVESEIDELMSGVSAIALEGPKGVGKKVTAECRAQTIYRLDDEAQRQVVGTSPTSRRIVERMVLRWYPPLSW